MIAVKACGPAAHDGVDGGVGCAADQRDGRVARHAAQRLDLIGDRRTQPRQGQVALRAERGGVKPGGMQQEAHRGARRGVPVAQAVAHRQDRLAPDQRLAQDRGEKARSRAVGRTRADADRGQAQAYPIEKATARIVGQQQFADRLLRAVAGERRQVEMLRHRVGQGRAENRAGRGEHDARAISIGQMRDADRLEERAGAVEVDPVALVEIDFGLGRDDGGEVEDDAGACRDQRLGRAGQGKVCRAAIGGAGKARGGGGSHDIEQQQVVVPPRGHEPRGKFAAQHPGGPDDGDGHGSLSLPCVRGNLTCQRAPVVGGERIFVRKFLQEFSYENSWPPAGIFLAKR